MTSLLDLPPTDILHPAYGTVFVFGVPHVGQHVGVVYLFDDGAAASFGSVPTPYYCRFEIVRVWDRLWGDYRLGWVPVGKRNLSAEEVLFLRRVIEREFA